MNPFRYLFLFLIVLILLPGCSNEPERSAVVIGIASDPESLNPLYSFSGYEMGIAEVLYPSLVQHHWSNERGLMVTTPLLAASWEWESDSSSLKVQLRDDIKWSDGRSVTSDDIEFSFDMFSDPVVQSRLYGVFRNFNTDENLKILPGTFEKESPQVFRIHFKKNSVPTIIDIDVPVLPKHIFGSIGRDSIIYAEKNLKQVTCGPYRLKSWQRNQSIILEKNSESFLVSDESPEEIIFRVIPDYNSRLTQLLNGEIDLAEDIKVDNVERIKGKDFLVIEKVKAREYDYIGWNNIDPQLYSGSKKIQPNPLFGDPEIRKALTMAVNRDEIISGYLLNYGEPAFSPLSPIFTDYFNSEINPLTYNPAASREILNKAGWTDKNGDGIIEKNGKQFSFTLFYPSGNPRREFAAVIIKNNLKNVGINAEPEPVEPSVFFEKMFNRELNAWIAGWSIPVPPDLKPYWYSVLEEAPFNVGGFRDTYMDMILDKLEKEKDPALRTEFFRDIQLVFYNENPATFLYWIDNIVVYNRRIKIPGITPLGAVHNLWEWKIDV